MSYRNLPEDLVELVNPVDVRGYALAEGWERVEGVNGTIALYHHPGSDLDQLIVPLDPAVDGYGRSMADVIARIAELAVGRPPVSVLNDLLLPSSDVLRFRRDDAETQRGSLSLEQAVKFIVGMRPL